MNSLTPRFKLALTLATLAPMAAALPPAGADDLSITIQVDGGRPFEFDPPGDDAGNGVFNYSGEILDADFLFSWTVNGAKGQDSICAPALLNPAMSVVNTSLGTHTYVIRFSHVATASAGPNSVAAASVGGSVTADLGGGLVSSVSGAPVLVSKIDGATVLSAYPGLSLSLPTGSATLAPICSWDPYDFKPPVAAAISSEFAFAVSAGEQVSFSSVLVAGPPPCPDIAGGPGVDGADLGRLLAQWGRCGDADLNYDGKVDGADLGMMLSSWGQECGVPAATP